MRDDVSELAPEDLSVVFSPAEAAGELPGTLELDDPWASVGSISWVPFLAEAPEGLGKG